MLSFSGFNHFIYSQIVPASFTLVMKPEFELNDAGAYQVLVEIAKVSFLQCCSLILITKARIR